jgi:DNA repair protein RecO (recombination protein O)
MAAWQDNGIVLGIHPFGEGKGVVHLLTENNGHCSGVVRGIRSKSMRLTVSPGSLVHAAWRARLDEHLGTLSLELIKSSLGSIIESQEKMLALSALTSFIMKVLPERHPYEKLYQECIKFIESLDAISWQENYIKLELTLLKELGFSLKLDQCCVTGEKNNLQYVSPKTGRAVSEKPATPYKEKLLPLPKFLTEGGEADKKQIMEGLELTEHFLKIHYVEPKYKDFFTTRERLFTLLSRT